jgi:hypothetical protein
LLRFSVSFVSLGHSESRHGCCHDDAAQFFGGSNGWPSAALRIPELRRGQLSLTFPLKQGMATKREMMFWQKHRDDGSLLPMVRAHRDRAIKFFGAFAVFGENELQLLRLLEAHQILTTSDEDLMVELNRVPEMMAPELEKIEPSALRDQVSKMSRFTMVEVAAMKLRARQRLKRAISKDRT